MAAAPTPIPIDLAHELDEIRQQQTLLLTLLDHTHAGVVVHDAAGSIRYMNSSARNLFGLTLANMADAQIQQGHWWLFDENGVRLSADQLPANRVLQYGTPIDDLQMAIQPFDASELRWCDVKAAPVRDLDGSIKQVVVTFIDMTGQHKALAALNASESRLRSILEQAPVAVAVCDAAGRLQSVNAAYCRMFGYSSDELIGQPMTIITPPAFRDVTAELYRRFLETGQGLRGEWDACTKDGRSLTILSSGTLLAGSQPSQVITFIVDVTEKKHLENDLIHKNALLEKRASEDGLTGLLNRQTIFERLQIAIQRCTRYGDALSVMMLDVDFFKQINDTYGHEAGDQVLMKVAHTIRDTIRQVDTAGRYGGEEFFILLPNVDQQGAIAAAERLRLQIAALRFPLDELDVTVSIGVASHQEGDDMQFLVNRADLAMYQSKRAGRNQVHAG